MSLFRNYFRFKVYYTLIFACLYSVTIIGAASPSHTNPSKNWHSFVNFQELQRSISSDLLITDAGDRFVDSDQSADIHELLIKKRKPKINHFLRKLKQELLKTSTREIQINHFLMKLKKKNMRSSSSYQQDDANFESFDALCKSDINKPFKISKDDLNKYKIYQPEQQFSNEEYVYANNGYQYPTALLAPLHYACQKGYIHVVQALIEAGFNPNQYDSSGRTPLHYTCMSSGSVEIFKLLLQNNADLNLISRYPCEGKPHVAFCGSYAYLEKHCLGQACHNNAHDIIHHLLQTADLTLEQKNKLLIAAEQSKSYETAHILRPSRC